MTTHIVANILVGAIAALHIYILVLEMFLWTKPSVRKSFKQSAENAKNSATLAANQGLYNGFLAAGLVWGLLHPSGDMGDQIKVFFLACVAVAGIYGGWTVYRRIFFIQTMPAVVTLVLLFCCS